MNIYNNSFIVKNIVRSDDERGSILSIVDNMVSNVSIIQCNSDSIRSNHYHYEDWHFMYVLEGEIDYFYKGLEIDSEIKYLKVKEGNTIYTPPNEIHATYFPKNTILIVSSKNPRDQITYEKDTVRVDFVNHKNITLLLEQHANERI
jgi:quercetin dioxygenase-like cupin family protein